MEFQTVPISEPEHIKLVGEWLSDPSRFDPAFHLMFCLCISTGYRISDICRLRYKDINFKNNTIAIVESKGRLSRQARARLKVLTKVLPQIINHWRHNDEKHFQSAMIKPCELYSRVKKGVDDFVLHDIVPNHMRGYLLDLLKDAENGVVHKVRKSLISDSLSQLLAARQETYKGMDAGYIFCSRTLSSNRARGCEKSHTITRGTAHRNFRKIEKFLEELGEKPSRIGAHGLRKSYALQLYNESGHDLAMTIRAIGHGSATTTLKYIGIQDDEAIQAHKTMLNHCGI